MSPLDALYAFEDLRARVMVPIRHGTFALSYERMNDPERWLAELVAERHLERFVVKLAAGESRVFVPPAAAGYEASHAQAEANVLAPPPPARGQWSPPARALSEPDAPTMPGATVVSPVETVPGRARRAPALIVDHEDETAVFDRPLDASSPAEDDDEDEERTRAMDRLPSDPDSEPMAAPVPGSR
jgi:hypothetical protein